MIEVAPRKNEKYRISGTNVDMLFYNPEEENFYCEPGALVCFPDTIRISPTTGTNQNASAFRKVISMGKRIAGGEDLFLLKAEGTGEVVISGKSPGKIVPLVLSCDSPVFALKDAFLAGSGSFDISFSVQKLSRAIFGGTGLITQKLTGNGTVFVFARGDFIVRELKEGERLLVDPANLLCWDMDFRVKTIKDIKMALFGGEGLFLAEFEGPGTLVLQSSVKPFRAKEKEKSN